MKDYQDAYGHQLYDYFKGKGSFEIVENDDGYFDVSSFCIISSKNEGYFSKFKDWLPGQRKAMRYVKGRVLDIGCGAGKHSLYLQEKGFDVLGIDISPLAVRVCKLRGLKKARVMSITQINSKLGRFDTILMLGCNFGLFGSPKRAKWLLKRFHGITNENARIIAESIDPYKTTNAHHLEYHEFNRRRGRMPGQLRIRVRYKKYVTPWFDYLIVSRNEMKEIFKDTGWRIGRFIDSKWSYYMAIIEKEGER